MIGSRVSVISYGLAVMPTEKEHGHQGSSKLETLEWDAKAAGLRVVYRTGIFFMTLANFQSRRLTIAYR